MRRAPALTLTASCLIAGACPSQVTTAAREPAIPGRAAPTELPGPRMDAIGESLRAQGFEPAGTETSGTLSGGGRLVLEVPVADVPRRLVLVAIGSGVGLSLDLLARRPDGAVARDTAPDDRAAIEIPVGAGEGVAAEVLATEGQGEALVRVFAAPVEASPSRLAGLFDADPLPRSSWQDVVARARAMGFAISFAPRSLAMRRGERESTAVRLATGTCYLFAAAGSAGVDRVAMRLKRDRILLAADPSGRPEAWIRYCADEDADASLGVEVAAGSGTIALGGFEARAAQLGPDGDPPLRSAAPALALDALDRLAGAQLESRGLDPASARTILDEMLAAGDRRETDVRLEAKECAIVSAVADPRLAELDIGVRSPDGSPRAESRPGAFGPETGVCAKDGGVHVIETVALVGQGRVRLRLYRVPGPSIETPEPWLALPAREASAAFARVGLFPSGAPVPLARDARGGAGWSGSVPIDDGACHGLALLGQGGPLAFAASGSDRDEIGLARGDEAPVTMVVCDRKETSLAIAAETAASSQTLYVLVFSSRPISPARRP
jgi:hypothetical protein